MPRYLCATVLDDWQAYAILDFTPAVEARIKAWVEGLEQLRQRDGQIGEIAGMTGDIEWYETEDVEAFEAYLGDERAEDVFLCSAWVELEEGETPEALKLIHMRTDYDKMLVNLHSTQFEACIKNTNLQLRTQSFDHPKGVLDAR